MLEVHVIFSREMFGPDVSASVTTKELCRLVEGIRFIEKMNTHPVDKEWMARIWRNCAIRLPRASSLAKNLPAGTVLRAEHLALKKPGTGIPAARLTELVGCRLKRPVKTDEMITEDILDL